MVKFDTRGIHFGPIQTWLGFLGLISYEIYLVHMPVIHLLEWAFNFEFRYGSFILFPITMAVSTLGAYLMHRILTAPSLRKRERIYSFLSNRLESFSRSFTPLRVQPQKLDDSNDS